MGVSKFNGYLLFLTQQILQMQSQFMHIVVFGAFRQILYTMIRTFSHHTHRLLT